MCLSVVYLGSVKGMGGQKTGDGMRTDNRSRERKQNMEEIKKMCDPIKTKGDGMYEIFGTLT